MLMYGLFHKPFFNEDDTHCDFCVEDARREKMNIKNTRIAGPIFLVLGITLIVLSVIKRKQSLKEHVQQGTNAMSSTGGGVVGYSATGSSVSHQENYQQPGQPAYPPPQSTYPPPVQPPLQAQGGPYPPPQFQGQAGGYPPPQQPPSYPPSVQQYPPPPQQNSQPPQYAYPPLQQQPAFPGQQNQQPSTQPGAYLNQAGPLPSKTGFVNFQF